MKKFKKLFALVVAAALVVALSITASAQDVGGEQQEGKGQITISNAAKGVKYKVKKLFDASVTGSEGGSIAYSGEIPDALSAYFTKDAAGNISATEAAGSGENMSDGLKTALKEWAGSADDGTVSDGSTLVFNNLDYGYYVVCTTQGEAAVTVTSTNPKASVYDKNSTIPLVPGDGKTVDDENVNIGQTLTYTLKFETANYEGSGSEAKQILSYIAEDTLPAYLTNVTITSLTIGGTEKVYTAEELTAATAAFTTDKKIVIPWVNGTTSLYSNGAEVVITYTAVVGDGATIAGAGNTNEFTMKYTTDEGEKTPEQNTDTVTVKTYAFAIKKVDDKAAPLAGAEFELPFYVKTTAAADGSFVYGGTEAGDGLTKTVTSPESGEIVIKGIEAGKYNITETNPPKGYNKIDGSIEVEAVETSATSTTVTKYINAEGEVVDEQTDVTVTYTNQNFAADPVFVVNKTGAELPSTGGIGTTIFYILGSILVIGAGVLLVTKRRMDA